jgi:hypothetical protein
MIKVKSTTFIINGIKTRFDYAKINDFYFNQKFTTKQECRQYSMTSFGEVRIKYLRDIDMFLVKSVRSDLYDLELYISK